MPVTSRQHILTFYCRAVRVSLQRENKRYIKNGEKMVFGWFRRDLNKMVKKWSKNDRRGNVYHMTWSRNRRKMVREASDHFYTFFIFMDIFHELGNRKGAAEGRHPYLSGKTFIKT